ERRGWVNTREVTEGMVTTLREQDGTLRRLGQVGGLGKKDNESIRAVRFIEGRGYVITFRQTDPLYVLDLRDAAAPKVLGELKIPGYSGYLHPVGKNLLLGVGQSGADANPDAQAGVQFSLFDISNPVSPRRIDTHTYGAGAATAEFDPKAFLYWQPRDLIIAPAEIYGDDEGRGAFNGVVLLRANEDGLAELGKVRVAADDGVANRSFVIGDDVFVLSDQALQSTSLDTLRPIDKLGL
ncbi:MAG TPA: beta-propeller domain-containing protein, partial [Microlunatus sp.]